MRHEVGALLPPLVLSLHNIPYLSRERRSVDKCRQVSKSVDKCRQVSTSVDKCLTRHLLSKEVSNTTVKCRNTCRVRQTSVSVDTDLSRQTVEVLRYLSGFSLRCQENPEAHSKKYRHNIANRYLADTHLARCQSDL